VNCLFFTSQKAIFGPTLFRRIVILNKSLLEQRCTQIIRQHREQLASKIKERRSEMELDTTDHYLIYRVLGIEEEESPKIDIYQNIGRFVYKYAETLLENLTKAILFETKGGKRIHIPNIISQNPGSILSCV